MTSPQHVNWQHLTEEVRRRLGPGAPLEPAARGYFEGRLGHPLGAVLVHRGSFATHLAGGLGAAALTSRGHVIGEPETAPGLAAHPNAGPALLAHELTHAIQQSTPAEPALQRDPAPEPAAQSVEHALLHPVAPAAQPIDPEAIAALLYTRLIDELLLSRERGLGV